MPIGHRRRDSQWHRSMRREGIRDLSATKHEFPSPPTLSAEWKTTDRSVNWFNHMRSRVRPFTIGTMNLCGKKNNFVIAAFIEES